MKFSGGNISVREAARIMNKDYQFVREGLIQGKLDFGIAIKKDGREKYDFYISPKKFYELTGYSAEEEHSE